jgi:AraC family transcriptional regulator, regulatory protein of adaptative response / DNA-3-methyladenine glycosylase II
MAPLDTVQRLSYRPPFDWSGLLAYLQRRAVPGIEEVRDGEYIRSLRLSHGGGTVRLRAGGPGGPGGPRGNDAAVEARFELDDELDLAAATNRTRRLLDLDADPTAVAEVLTTDPWLGPLVRATPGRRLPGTVDGPELAVRAVLGQQISLAAAATAAGRLVTAHGTTLKRPRGAVTHLFPSPEALAAANPVSLRMPQSRARCLTGLAASLAAGELVLDPAGDLADSRRQLLALPGIGPWTEEYIAMRALGDHDAFPDADLGIRHALQRRGLDGGPAAARALAERWRPYRAYAVIHLWADLASAAAA